MPEPVRQAFILAGGKGERLGEITRTIPKPLVEIDKGRVFLDFLIAQLARHNFDDIVLLAGRLGHLIRDRYDGQSFGAARIRVLIEPAAQGTAGALLMARDIVMPRFLVLNGDSLFDIDLRSLAAEAEANSSEALLALHRTMDPSRYGTVDLVGNRIVRFREKSRDVSGPAFMSAGIYVLTSGIVSRIGRLPCSIETDVFPALAREGALSGSPRDGYFVDIGLPETLRRARQELPARINRTDSSSD